jgi:hypothetical protein
VSVFICQQTRRHIPADFNLHEVHRNSFKYRSVLRLCRAMTSRHWTHSTFIPFHLRDSLQETVVPYYLIFIDYLEELKVPYIDKHLF